MQCHSKITYQFLTLEALRHGVVLTKTQHWTSGVRHLYMMMHRVAWTEYESGSEEKIPQCVH